ncbi:hypothetical protein J27TS8_13090 [Robertmurraya siralis]|uniref:Cytochrome c-type biogenesis protein n=1 Tax=Robertmurraya siralis TaxID=77777 RepID=A0A919WG21_9BACI|nr:cytochrome c-type biogenesis protein CcmH [Robertmurraya siralis]PAE18998.1 hypothetical protein CHH80_18725 [Bacillus sp. 7504-2]GIN61316.1 hypothetical protein J27TS8_13090 [Robertmurraya siralis]
MKGKYLLFVLLLFFLSSPTSVWANFDYNAKEFQEVVNQLDMQGHSNDDLATCKVKQMYYKEVQEMLDEGMTPEEIIEFYVAEYGQSALKEPAKDKSGLIAWSMPIVGVLTGIAVLFYWLKRGKKKVSVDSSVPEIAWESEEDKEITEKIFEEERRKHF